MKKGRSYALMNFNLAEAISYSGVRNTQCEQMIQVHVIGNAIVLYTEDGSIISIDDSTISGLAEIEEFEATPEIKCFPNPSNGIINFQSTENIDRITILNVNGMLIKELEYQNQKSISISLQQIANGMYFAKIICKKQETTIPIIFHN